MMFTPGLMIVASLFVGDSETPTHPARLLVKVSEGATAREIAATHAKIGGRVLRDLPQIGWQVVQVAEARRDEARIAYTESRAFERADLDGARKLAHAPNDPYWPGMGHMTAIGADIAWNTHKGDPNVIIGVIDTGLDVSHPDLAANVWINPGEIAGNGVDDDNNGYIDDVNGFDFAYNDGVPDDVFGHGTACAGIIAAVQDNNLGVTGVAPLCKVAGLKAAIDSGYLYDSAVVPAIVYCGDMGFKVASQSFYGDDVTPAERDAIDYAFAQGCLPIAAAGNDARIYPYYPAAYDNCVAVAALDSSGNKAWFSNWGSWVDVAAPGVSISTTTVGGGYTTGFAGTSGACPHAAGVAALLFSANASATPTTVRAALENSCIPLIQAPFGEYTSYGKIWAPEALACLTGIGTCSPSAPRFQFVAPCGGGPIATTPLQNGPGTPAWFLYGTHMDQVGAAQWLRSNGTPLTPIPNDRSSMRFIGDVNLGTYTIQVGAINVLSLPWSSGPGWHYAPTDLGTNSAGVIAGSFSELLENDGVFATCSSNGNGEIYLEATIRKVLLEGVSTIELQFDRSYVVGPGAVETIEVYDWSTWSFPYGTFVNVSSTPAPTSATPLLVQLPGNAARFLDPEGTLYMKLRVSNAGFGAHLDADRLRIVVF